ncbi:hypothetical protein FACS1894186_3120 [Alphaproteobacteria bacterium]|nr:hypothetical protein FACS1894186_3120 [Alphaproteobacteria bacterium]
MSKNKTLMWVLAVSLAANLFLAGFTAARYVRAGERCKAASERMMPLDRRVAAKLSSEGQALVSGRMEESGPALREKFAELRKWRGQLREAMEAQGFDRTAADEAWAGMRKATDDIGRITHEIAMDLAGKLSHDDRAQMLRNLDRHAVGEPRARKEKRAKGQRGKGAPEGASEEASSEAPSPARRHRR